MKKFKNLGGKKQFEEAKKSAAYEKLTPQEKAGFAAMEKELLEIKMYEDKDVSRRNCLIIIRVSRAERDMIRGLAKIAGRPVSNYLRAAALGMLGK